MRIVVVLYNKYFLCTFLQGPGIGGCLKNKNEMVIASQPSYIYLNNTNKQIILLKIALYLKYVPVKASKLLV